MLDITLLMSDLAVERPVFHSEADFQPSLAWSIHHNIPHGQVRLEYKPFADKRMYLDLWLPGKGVALELKYRTRQLNVEQNGELFALRNQSAQDISRYDFLKDLQRLEQLSEISGFTAGFAIFLTNDATYWKPPSRSHTVDAAFRVHEGEREMGKIAWSEKASAGTTKHRKTPICLNGSYEMRWQNYGHTRRGSYPYFRYLAIETSARVGESASGIPRDRNGDLKNDR